MDKVRVYWNLHKKCWSVQDCKTGRVIRHESSVTLSAGKFVVRKAGQEKVRREGKKNVHAFAVGTVSTLDGPAFFSDYCRPVSYNPYVNDTFVFRDTGESVTDIDTIVVAINEGRPCVWAYKNPKSDVGPTN